VRQFNARVAAADLDPGLYSLHFPESHVPALPPRPAGKGPFQEQFVALDERGIVRGGYILKHQWFVVEGRECCIADYQLPISEGIADRRFAAVALRLLEDALAKQPLLFGLGMGGYHVPIARFLDAAGWRTGTVPFLFRVIHPRAFLSNIALPNMSRLGRAALGLAAATGLGGLAVRLRQALGGSCRPPRAVACEHVEAFDDWADAVWHRAKDGYGLVAVRDREVLEVLYPRHQRRFLRLKVTRDKAPIGWAVLLDTQMSGHKFFGRMRVGSVVDCLARPEDAADVAACAGRVLEDAGVDLIVSNQAHAAWCGALKRCGFLGGPSNFLFTAAPKLACQVEPFAGKLATFHLNRGDGDGPINL
jgi:hypothetical protein